MVDQKQKILSRFFSALDPKTTESLTESQRQDIEQALLTVNTLGRHKMDVRKSFGLFGRRFYWVFLFGRDHRRFVRHENRFIALFLALGSFALGVFLFLFAVLALYLIKSALGINVFQNYSFGIWDWFQQLWH